MLNKIKVLFIIAMMALLVGLIACTATEPYPETAYFTSIVYPNGYWEEISVPANAMGVLTGEAPLESNMQSGFTYYFADEALPTNEKTVHFTIDMPHNYKEGTDIIFNVHWAFRNDEVGTKVRWRLTTSWANEGVAFPASSNLWALSNESNNDNSVHQVTKFSAISGVGKNITSSILCYLQRNSSNALDTYTDVAILVSVSMLYQVDAPGSIYQWAK
jgi:hypothetical protein